MLCNKMRENPWYENDYVDEWEKALQDRATKLRQLLDTDKASLENLDEAAQRIG